MPHADNHQASEFTPTLYPPFPDSPSYPTVTLETISLPKLLANDASEQERVFAASKTRGFFYLELEGCQMGETIKDGADDIARVAEKVFQMDLKDKMSYSFENRKDLFGYKYTGQTRVDKAATPDTAEFFNISKDAMLASNSIVPEPPLITESKPLFASYVTAAHTVGLHILSDLIHRLGADPSEITSRHLIDKAAGDHIRMTRGPPRKDEAMPEIQTPSHTDFGSITILMNWLGGLQVWSHSARRLGPLEPDVADGAGEWLWVKPKPGCAIVNMGDAAVKFTNGVLCSGRHRVVPAPGEQGLWPRYSIVYFVRPNDECLLRTLEGEGIPKVTDEERREEGEGIRAKEWIHRQAEALRTGKHVK